MLVSLRWLKDYVDIDISAEALADKLTMAGLEVDAIQKVAPGFDGVVVCEVVSVSPHPNADKLSLCEVSTGLRSCPVVCGAPNVRPGMISAFAQGGAVIPGGYTIKSTKIRGVQSEGMLCSEAELGIGDDASGIMDLSRDLRPGEDLATALKLHDTVFDIGITPNRSDCLSIIGIAREAAAASGQELRYPDLRVAESGEEIARLTSVTIEDPDLCPRYSARIIQNIKIGPSPAWMRMRLEAVGLRAINNIVDITNFVMMEMGQPLHAFDFRFLEENRIVVRRAREGEEFISLDGKTRILNADALMICDGRKPVAVAGIMGGQNSEVQEETATVFLESAYFNPVSIRRSSKRLGMSTDAAYRFERGIDPEGVIKALDRAAQLMADLSGGSVVKGRIDEYPRKVESAGKIPLRTKRVREVLGIEIDDSRIEQYLTKLGMTVHGAGSRFEVVPPTFRVDIRVETDLIEEIARLHGYERIPETLPEIRLHPGEDRRRSITLGIREVLTVSGFTEVINYSFSTPSSADVLSLAENDDRRRFIKILNPLTEEQSVMRTTLIYGLLETLKRNLNVGNSDLRVFERGRAFIAQDPGSLPLEKEHLCGLMSGTRYGNLWSTKGETVDFYDLKGCVEKLLDRLGIRNTEYAATSFQPYLHPGKACEIRHRGSAIGFMGEVHPNALDKMDIRAGVFVFELDVKRLLDTCEVQVAFRDIPRFPASYRDAAFLVDRQLEFEQIYNLAMREREELLEKIEIFDVYMGKNIPENTKSLALRFTYRSPERTLTDDEVNRVHTDLIKKISDLIGARIRGE